MNRFTVGDQIDILVMTITALSGEVRRSLMAVMTRGHPQYVPNEGTEIEDAKWKRNHEQGFVADRERPEL